MQIIKTQTDKLVVGSNDVSHPDGKDKSPTGTTVLNGPVYVGKTGASPNYEAVLNVTSNSAQQLPGDQQPACKANLAIKADGNVKIDGDGKTADALVVTGDQTINSGNLHTSNLLGCSGQGCSWSGSSINVQGWKGFDIKHPTKENHRLRYVCLEGPEGGVYYRGILKDSEFIELPDYWKDLVDTKTITVHLTPIGTYQYLYYTVAKNRIIVKNHSNLPTHCSYIVYGERKDGERLIPEYEGNSPEDYPGKNDQYSIAGYHYDRRTL